MNQDGSIVITGAAGMIGSGVVRHLNDLGMTHLVLVDDVQKTDKWKNLVGKQFSHWISRHRLFDWLRDHGGEVSAVLHFGACSDTMQTDGDYLLENNFRFTIRLAEWALNANKRLIYASSAATYGDGVQGFSDSEDALEELKPINMYAFSKHLVDLWMRREKVLDRVVGLKYFNVFGPNEYHKGRMASMVLKMSHIAQKGEGISLYKSNDPGRFADGEQVRDFIYVKDAVKMTCAFLQNTMGGIYNIGSGNATTWNVLASELFDALDQKADIRYVDMPVELHRQYQNYTCADMSKFNKIFHQFSMTPIKGAVREYVREYLLHQARW